MQNEVLVRRYLQVGGVCVGVWVCMCGHLFMPSIQDTFMNLNLQAMDVPSIEDGPRSLDIGNDLEIT